MHFFKLIIAISSCDISSNVLILEKRYRETLSKKWNIIVDPQFSKGCSRILTSRWRWWYAVGVVGTKITGAHSNFVSAASVRQCFIFTIQRGTHGGTVSRRSEHPLEVSAASALPSRTRYTLADDPAGTWRMTEYTPLESQPPTPGSLAKRWRRRRRPLRRFWPRVFINNRYRHGPLAMTARFLDRTRCP